MKIEPNFSFTAPSELAKVAPTAVPKVQIVKAAPEASRDTQAGSNSRDAVKTDNISNTPKQEKLDALADRLAGNNTSLVIEKNPNGAGFIYKSINKETGEVTRVWPHEEIVSELAAMQDVDARGLMLDESA
ncbi:MAG: flagellar protein FlaG [Pseudomonadota bacterium]